MLPNHDSISNPQAQTPLLDILKACACKPHAAFYVPGHKRGQGISQQLSDWLGTEVFCADLPELPELGNLFPPQGVMEQAQQLAAKAFGAAQTWFLANGSTSGVIAAILATCETGDKIILPRNVHQSAIAGLVLSGAIPIFITPEYDPEADIVYSITPAAVEAALAQHPDAKAVIVVYPTYQGICGDVGAIARVAHHHNIPLLVDEAHGAHFSFHPDLPPSALSLGADVAVQSIHKTLGAMTQASMLHLQGQRVEPARISKALQLLQSSSPSNLLLASLDAARQQVALYGHQLMTKAIQLADQASDRLSKIPGLLLFKPTELPKPGCMTFDRTRLTLNVTHLGLSGFEADEILHEQLGVTAELPTSQNLTFIITFGNTQADIDQLVQAVTTLARDYRRNHLSLGCVAPLSPSESLLSPRRAFFAPTETLPLEKAVGRISAELVCPYPPGIPALMPGEAIAPATLNYLQHVLTLSRLVSIKGCSDSTLRTLKVVR